MSVDRSTRTLLAILFLLAALFVAMNRVVESAPAGDWWLPLLLFVIGAGLALSLRSRFGSGQPSAEPVEAESMGDPDPALPGGSDLHSYRVSATTVPLAQTMTIRPDPEAETQRVVSVTEEGVIPFMGETKAEPVAAADQPSGLEAAKAAEGVEVADVEALASAEAPASVEPIPAETATPAAPTGKPDDLTKVRGVGKKSAQALKDAGIDSFQKLANSTDDAIRAALDAGGVRLVGEVDTWRQQAAYAARGDWAGLDQFNAEQRSASSD